MKFDGGTWWWHTAAVIVAMSGCGSRASDDSVRRGTFTPRADGPADLPARDSGVVRPPAVDTMTEPDLPDAEAPVPTPAQPSVADTSVPGGVVEPEPVQSPDLALAALVGGYDVWLDDVPSIDGCTPAWTDTRLNLRIGEDDGVVGVITADWQWETDHPRVRQVGATSFEFEETTFLEQVTAPAIRFETDDTWFPVTGELNMPYQCDDSAEPMRVWLPIRVTADETAPRLRAEPTTPGPLAFAFSNFRFEFSEPVVSPSGLEVWAPEEADGNVGFVDEAGQPVGVAFHLRQGLGDTHAAFTDLAEVEGKRLFLTLTSAFMDGSGNVAVADSTPIDVLVAAKLGDGLDFDDAPDEGLYGGARLVSNGASDSPCESGSCVLFEGRTPLCSDLEPGGKAVDVPLLALQLNPPSTTYRYTMRLRLFTATEEMPTVEVHHTTECSLQFATPPLEPLDPVDGRLTLATPWYEPELSPCNPEFETGFVLSVGCSTQVRHNEFRIVIESLTRTVP